MIRLAVGVAVVLLAELATAQVVDRVVATVGSTLITLSDLRAVRTFGLLDVTAETSDEAIVARLVDHELVRSEVDRFGLVEPVREAVEERLAAIAGRFPNAAAFDAALARTAMTEVRLRAFVRDELRRARYLDERFSAASTPTEDEVARAYQEEGLQYAVDDEIPPLDEVRDKVRARLMAERRDVLVAQWLDGLRRRADIRRPAVLQPAS